MVVTCEWGAPLPVVAPAPILTGATQTRAASAPGSGAIAAVQLIWPRSIGWHSALILFGNAIQKGPASGVYV